MRRLWPGGLLAAALAVGGACGEPKVAGSDEHCTTEEQCTTGNRCLSGTCVPPAKGGSTWAIEILPGPAGLEGSGGATAVPARVTELEAVTFEADSAALTADATTSLGITFSYPGTALPPPIKSNVLWTVPPVIPGRPDLTFETFATSDVQEGHAALLEVPTDVKGRSGLLRLNPWPTEAGSPPYSFEVTPEPVTGRLKATIGNSVSLRGRVRDAAGNPFPDGTFMAQAFQGESLVSNSCTVDIEGRFALLIPAAVATDAVQLALIPSHGNTDPAFLSKGQDVALPVTTLDVMLPSYVPRPRYFKLRLTNSDGDPVDPGMLVHARAVLRADENGTTVFGQNAVSLADGTATLALLPGTQSVKLRYSFVVSPGVTSTFTTYCSGEADAVEISEGSTDRNNPTALPIVSLVSRFRVSGTVFKHNGSAVTHDGRVANVVVTATLLEAAHPDCPPRVPTVSTTTDLDGNFQLYLDPGRYRFDYDPPANAPIPRKTETDVPVTSYLLKAVELDEATFVAGVVYGPGDQPLPVATIRLYDVLCRGDDDCFGPNRTPPLLRAEAQTDALGRFTAVLSGP